MTEIPKVNPEQEKKEAPVADNARKFIVGPIDTLFLEEHKASSTKLIVDWLEIDEENETETKLAYKEDLSSGKIEILEISKSGVGSDRKTIRKDISQEEYAQRKKSLDPSKPHLEKTRYQFTYFQNGVPFTAKHDVFPDSDLCMLEVEDPNREFSLDDFPIELSEVSDDPRYSGYRVAEVINKPDQF